MQLGTIVLKNMQTSFEEIGYEALEKYPSPKKWVWPPLPLSHH